MRHRINGCLVNLRQLSEGELEALITANETRRECAEEEYESLVGERIRRIAGGHRYVQLQIAC